MKIGQKREWKQKDESYRQLIKRLIDRVKWLQSSKHKLLSNSHCKQQNSLFFLSWFTVFNLFFVPYCLSTYCAQGHWSSVTTLYRCFHYMFSSTHTSIQSKTSKTFKMLGFNIKNSKFAWFCHCLFMVYEHSQSCVRLKRLQILCQR